MRKPRREPRQAGGKLKEKGLYENTVILYASDHGSHFKTRNRDAHLNGYDDYKRSCHDGCLHVPLVICGGPFKGGKEVTELVSTESIPKTLLALAGVDVGDKMIGENLLDVVEKKIIIELMRSTPKSRRAAAAAASARQIICTLSMPPVSMAARLRHLMCMRTTSSMICRKTRGS